jgi:hypothetical protein
VAWIPQTGSPRRSREDLAGIGRDLDQDREETQNRRQRDPRIMERHHRGKRTTPRSSVLMLMS